MRGRGQREREIEEIRVALPPLPSPFDQKALRRKTSTAARSGHGRVHVSPLFSPEMESEVQLDAFERKRKP